MAKEEPELDPVTGNPISQGVKTDVEKHKHRWQGVRSGGKRLRMCSKCGKLQESEDD